MNGGNPFTQSKHQLRASVVEIKYILHGYLYFVTFNEKS
jgi:hypothetical protein